MLHGSWHPIQPCGAGHAPRVSLTDSTADGEAGTSCSRGFLLLRLHHLRGNDWIVKEWQPLHPLWR